MSESNVFIYNSIQNLYANDISDRFIGMYTFSDGNEPSARKALEAVGIKLDTDFRYNNRAIYMHPHKFRVDFNDCM